VRDLEKESNQCGDIGKVDCLQLLQGTKLLKEVLLEDGVVLGTFQEVIEASPIVSEIFERGHNGIQLNGCQWSVGLQHRDEGLRAFLHNLVDSFGRFPSQLGDVPVNRKAHFSKRS